ncbi:hypothetical protein [Pseudooceanicola algae]|uniref:hypothetical protein n=1 Tax=Pseudooceanicola algae TaxID=1537215 RepID=UPI000E6CF7E7|nr:hypothetical protein [Pseudooceanicola algae]
MKPDPIQHMRSAVIMPGSDVYALCRRLSRGGCGCAGRAGHHCAGLRELLALHGSVDAAHQAELARMEQVARDARC